MDCVHLLPLPWGQTREYLSVGLEHNWSHLLRVESDAKKEPPKRQLSIWLVLYQWYISKGRGESRGGGRQERKEGEEELPQGKILFLGQTGRDARQPHCTAVHHSGPLHPGLSALGYFRQLFCR